MFAEQTSTKSKGLSAIYILMLITQFSKGNALNPYPQ